MLAWPTKPAADAESAHRHHQNYRLKKELAYTQHSAIGFYREPEKYHFEDLTGSETDMQLENVVQLSLPLCRCAEDQTALYGQWRKIGTVAKR